MSSTQWGKVLIFGNVCLSLLFASWALGIYANRIDWGMTKESAITAKGKLAERKERVDELVKARDKAVVRWENTLTKLRGAEDLRPKLLAVYREELGKLENGTDAGGVLEEPVLELVYDKGALQFEPGAVDPSKPRDRAGRPRLQPIKWERTQKLLDTDRLNQQYNATMEELAKEKRTLDEVVREEKEETEKLNGDGKTKKGLRRQMEDVQQAMLFSLGQSEFLRRLEKSGVFLAMPIPAGVEGEREWLLPLLYNRMVERELLQQRQRRMEARLHELKNLAATARQR